MCIRDRLSQELTLVWLSILLANQHKIAAASLGGLEALALRARALAGAPALAVGHPARELAEDHCSPPWWHGGACASRELRRLR
eukprot:2548531-Alexandrium_andersonii.AAC.1